MDAQERRALRVLRLVHEFHKQGHQLMRVEPCLAPSGMYWRCAITPRVNIRRSHGALIADYSADDIVARYTSGQDNEYFGWRDAKHDELKQLVEKFRERYPAIVERSRGDDWAFAGWYVRMLGYAENGEFPMSYCDGYSDRNPRFLPLTRISHLTPCVLA